MDNTAYVHVFSTGVYSAFALPHLRSVRPKHHTQSLRFGSLFILYPPHNPFTTIPPGRCLNARGGRCLSRSAEHCHIFAVHAAAYSSGCALRYCGIYYFTMRATLTLVTYFLCTFTYNWQCHYLPFAFACIHAFAIAPWHCKWHVHALYILWQLCI